MRKRRHPWRGILGGILFGLAMALGSIVYAFNGFGPLTPWILLLVGIAIGVLLIFVPRPWGRRRRPPEVGART